MPGTTLAGGKGPGSVDGDVNEAKLYYPRSVAVSKDGRVFVAEPGYHRIREVFDGKVRTIAGDGKAGYGGDNGPAEGARLNYPGCLAMDSRDQLLICDLNNSRIRRIDTSGKITTIAGRGYATPSDGPVATAGLLYPGGIAVGRNDTLYILQGGVPRVRMLERGLLTTIVGKPNSGFTDSGYSGDGGIATEARFAFGAGIAYNPVDGLLYFADNINHHVRVWGRTNADGNPIIELFAGAPHYTGDTANPAEAVLFQPEFLVRDSAGNLYFTEAGNRVIRKMAPDGQLTTLVGTGLYRGWEPIRDGAKGNETRLSSPGPIALDQSGRLLFVDSNQIYRLDRGTITQFAGFGSGGSGTAKAASFGGISALGVDALDNVYVAEYWEHRVNRISAEGKITDFAGTGKAANEGDGGPATMAQVNQPASFAFGGDGSVYIGVAGGVRKVDSDGVIRTVVEKQCGTISGIQLMPDGSMLIANTNCAFLSWVSKAGVVYSRIAGNNRPGFSGDGGYAGLAQVQWWVRFPVLLDNGTVAFTDSSNHRIRLLTPNPPARMEVVTGDEQTVAPATWAADRLVVKILGTKEVAIPGLAVRFAVSEGQGTVENASVNTDSRGMASTRIRPSAEGAITVTASYGDLKTTFRINCAKP